MHDCIGLCLLYLLIFLQHVRAHCLLIMTALICFLNACMSTCDTTHSPLHRLLAAEAQQTALWTVHRNLLALEQAGQSQAPAHSIGYTASLLHPQAWEAGLSTYPDHRFAQFLLRGIQDGFHIGAWEHGRHQSSKRNFQSAYEHPQIIRDYKARE